VWVEEGCPNRVMVVLLFVKVRLGLAKLTEISPIVDRHSRQMLKNQVNEMETRKEKNAQLST